MSFRTQLQKASLVSTLVMAGFAGVATAPPSLAGWAPKPEPTFWREVRRSVMDQDPSKQPEWIFMEAKMSPKVDAAEYMGDPRRRDEIVTFQALLLVRRGESSPWDARRVSMRAQCLDGVLQRQNQEGIWSAYPGREGVEARVNWICAQAPKL